MGLENNSYAEFPRVYQWCELSPFSHASVMKWMDLKGETRKRESLEVPFNLIAPCKTTLHDAQNILKIVCYSKILDYI